MLDVSVSDREAASRLRPATVSAACERFRAHGAVVLRGAVRPAIVGALGGAVMANMRACFARIEARGSSADRPFEFFEICHRSQGRYDMQLREGVAPVPLREPRLTERAPWSPLLDALLGPNPAHLFSGAVVSMPGAEAQRPHVDGGQLFGVDEPGTVICPPHCATVFVPVERVCASRGPTELWPGTHTQRREGAVSAALAAAEYACGADDLFAASDALGLIADGTILADADGGLTAVPSVAPELDVGDVLVFDYRVVHRGLANGSGSPRPIVYFTHARSWFRDVVNFPADQRLFS